MIRENIRATVPKDIERKIRKRAEERGLTKSGWVRLACENYLRGEGKHVSSVGVAGDLQELEGYLIRLKSKHESELRGARARVRDIRSRIRD